MGSDAGRMDVRRIIVDSLVTDAAHLSAFVWRGIREQWGLGWDLRVDGLCVGLLAWSC